MREAVGILGNLAADFDFKQNPRAPLILPQQPVPAGSSTPAPAKARGMLVTGTITALSSTSVTVQVTGTGPHDTFLQGQTLTIALTPATTVQGTPQVGAAVSMRIAGTAGAYRANAITVQGSAG